MDREDLRLAVYAGFVEDGRAPDVGTLANRFAVSRDTVVAGLRQWAHQRHLVLQDGHADEVSVVMAHPFSAVPLGFAVMAADPVVGRLRVGLLRAAAPAAR